MFKIKKNKGFTLIELIVALALFSILVISAVEVGVSVIKSQRRGFSLQEVQEAGRYLMEYAIKEIRMGDIQSSTADSLSIINSSGENINYKFDTHNFMRQKELESWQNLNPNNIKLDGEFSVRQDAAGPYLVTIVMELESKGERQEEIVKMNIQNSVTPRAN
jgi:prepilin-type N-terminal cleavage/methylation domain-containing protein